MTYLVLDPDGTLRVEKEPPPIGKISELVGPEGTARAYPHHSFGVAVWVNEYAVALPDKYQRNIIGSCVVSTMGAPQRLYAGTMVITGYAFSDGKDLPAPILIAILEIHAKVSAVLAGTLTQIPDWAEPGWPQQIVEFAEQLRTAIVDVPVPDEIAFAELVLAAASAAISAGRGISYALLGGIIEDALLNTPHVGRQYTPERYAAAVQLLVDEGLVERQGDGTDEVDVIVAGRNYRPGVTS